MRKKQKRWILACALMFCLQGCTSNAQEIPPLDSTGLPPESTQTPNIDAQDVNWSKEQFVLNEEGVPSFSVYVVEDQQVETLDIETYVQGVLAGEMKNDWPLEALKAQAILARTFVLKFLQEKTSKYDGADISTDIEEAQAYDQSAINDNIKQAVNETAGIVLATYEGDLPYTWFHAHSGGITEYATAGLGWNQQEPTYTQVVESMEPETIEDENDNQALQDATHWEATFSKEEFQEACRSVGEAITLTDSSTFAIGEHGESGRAVTIDIDGTSVSATDLRLALGSTKMRSTLIDSIKLQNGEVYLSGKGYGHGVGMSQWGAYGLAEEGKIAEEIVSHYFQNVVSVKLW